jgi:hypothetical protein
MSDSCSIKSITFERLLVWGKIRDPKYAGLSITLPVNVPNAALPASSVGVLNLAGRKRQALPTCIEDTGDSFIQIWRTPYSGGNVASYGLRSKSARKRDFSSLQIHIGSGLICLHPQTFRLLPKSLAVSTGRCNTI